MKAHPVHQRPRIHGLLQSRDCRKNLRLSPAILPEHRRSLQRLSGLSFNDQMASMAAIPVIQRDGTGRRAPLLLPPAALGDIDREAIASAAASRLAAHRATLPGSEDLLDAARILTYYAVASSPAAKLPATAPDGHDGQTHSVPPVTSTLEQVLAAPLRLNYDAYCNARETLAAAGPVHAAMASLMTAALFLRVSRPGSILPTPST